MSQVASPECTGATPQLAMIVGAARSGTTLTRLLLDAHPALAAPAEAGIPALMAHLAAVWAALGAATDEPPQSDPDHGNEHGRRERTNRVSLSAQAREAVLEAARAPIDYYCRREGKSIYCDKSLDSVHHLQLVQELVPDVRCILLFRHVMDTVASGIEASPWGFQAYGYAPFVQAAPGNFVAALVSYWLSHVELALAWETEHPELCHRVRYEDLVRWPERTLAGVFDFLGVSSDMSVLERAFLRAGSATGPGDYKVVHTTGVHSESIGHGKRVPVGMIPPPLLEAGNAKLEALGYEPLSPAWNAQPRPTTSNNLTVGGKRLTVIMSDIRVEHSVESHSVSFAVVAEDHRDLRWVIEPATGEVRQGDGEVDSVVIGTAKDLALMLAGEENVGVLLRSGRIRHITGKDPAQQDSVAAINGMLAVLSSPNRAPNTTPAL